MQQGHQILDVLLVASLLAGSHDVEREPHQSLVKEGAWFGAVGDIVFIV